MAKTTKSGISFKINKIKRLAFFENDISQLGIKKEDVKNGNVSLEVKLKVDKKNNVLKFFVDVTFFVDKEKKEIELLGVSTLHVFEIKNLAAIITKDDKGRITLPNNIMLLLIDALISCTRGILVASKTNPEYQDIFLPLLPPRLVLDDIKEIMSS